MVHSVEVLFDSETESAIRGIWDGLMAVGVRSQAAHKSPSNRPHVTLTVADRMDDAVTAALRPALARLAPLRAVLPTGAGSLSAQEFASVSAGAFDRSWVESLVG